MTPTPDQVAAMHRAKNPPRKWFGHQPIGPKDARLSGEKIIPKHARLVR